MRNMIDWSESFLKPVSIEFESDGLSLSALGETIHFMGQVFSPTSDDKALRTEITVNNGCVLTPICTPGTVGRILSYCYFDGIWCDVEEIETAETAYCGIGVFLRRGKTSFFLSLDFPYSKFEHDGLSVRIGCDPKDELIPGEIYRPHTLTIGAAALTGIKVGEFDRAEIEAFSEYVRLRMPVAFAGDSPIFSATCITNRMTDVREGRIFYSMFDNPTLTLDPETIKEEISLCAALGIEYYQVFEGFYDWEKDGSTEQNLREIMTHARARGVRVGDYMTPLELNCWHYNYHDRHIQDKTLCALEENGNKRFLCYGNDKVVEFLCNTIVASIKRNGEEMICLDGNAAVPCFDPEHNHNPGSMYAQTRGLVRFIQAMNETSQYFMTWSNSGNWLEFMPKLLWYNQNVYLTDPHPRAYSASLNNLKYYGDCRREQMVTVHNKYFVPYSAFTNCEYYAFKHSRINDLAFFEYSFLQGLAVTPNICFGELRTFLERTASIHLPYVKAFIKKWLHFIRENIDVWKYTFQLADEPGAGANEAYAHINGDHGFICLVNQNQSTQSFSFTLDSTIGLKQNEGLRYLLSEVYPGEHPISEQPLPGPVYSDGITLSVKAFSVRIIKIEPYFADESGARLYGISAKRVQKDNGFEYAITGECGTTVMAALWLELGHKIEQISTKTVRTVPKYFFPTTLSHIEISGYAARFMLHMPRDRFEREILLWKVDGGDIWHQLTQKNSDFCGGYIHNFYKENQYATLFVTVASELAAEPSSDVTCMRRKTDNRIHTHKPPARRASTYETCLDIPFIEWPAMANPYGLDEVLELVFSDNLLVAGIKAYIDEKPVNVFTYQYPSEPSMKAYYIELVGAVKSGTKLSLRIEVQWHEPVKRNKSDLAVNKQGAQVVGQPAE